MDCRYSWTTRHETDGITANPRDCGENLPGDHDHGGSRQDSGDNITGTESRGLFGNEWPTNVHNQEASHNSNSLRQSLTVDCLGEPAMAMGYPDFHRPIIFTLTFFYLLIYPSGATGEPKTIAASPTR
jgi:hypothetical protein